MNSLNLLIQQIPQWVEVNGIQLDALDISVSPPSAGGGDSSIFHLKIQPSKQLGVMAMEHTEQRRLPEFCLERHINPDSTFCLYYGSEARLSDAYETRSWWSGLGTFLQNQIYAEKHKVWPLAAGLSHGEAAKEQLTIEQLADTLGWKDDILSAIFRKKGWLANKLPRVSKNIDRIYNARSPCPRGCTWKHKRLRKKSCSSESCYPNCNKKHKPILRAECPNSHVVDALVLHEHRRQKLEKKIINKLIKDGKRCCGTMKFCPLQKHHELGI